MGISINIDPDVIRIVDSNAIRSILDTVPVRELEALKLDETEEDATS